MIEARHLRKEFVLKRDKLFGSPNRVLAVDDVSFKIVEGKTFGLIGESGSGKTTVAKMLLRLEAPTSGSLTMNGREMFSLNRKEDQAYRRSVQAVLQDPYGALSPRMRISRILSEPLQALGIGSDAERLDRASEALSMVKLRPDVVNRYPHEFSGGQRQRIAIARALTVNPKLLVLDEPVSALDVSVRAQILELLRELQQRLNMTYVFIGHDLAVVRYLSSMVGVMYFGRIVEVGPAGSVLKRPYHPYTVRLLSASTGDEPLSGTLLAAMLPNPLNPPSGCQFRTRCKFATQTCVDAVPTLQPCGADHEVACHHYEEITSGRKQETGPIAA